MFGGGPTTLTASPVIDAQLSFDDHLVAGFDIALNRHIRRVVEQDLHRLLPRPAVLDDIDIGAVGSVIDRIVRDNERVGNLVEHNRHIHQLSGEEGQVLVCRMWRGVRPFRSCR